MVRWRAAVAAARDEAVGGGITPPPPHPRCPVRVQRRASPLPRHGRARRHGTRGFPRGRAAAAGPRRRDRGPRGRGGGRGARGHWRDGGDRRRRAGRSYCGAAALAAYGSGGGHGVRAGVVRRVCRVARAAKSRMTCRGMVRTRASHRAQAAAAAGAEACMRDIVVVTEVRTSPGRALPQSISLRRSRLDGRPPSIRTQRAPGRWAGSSRLYGQLLYSL